MEIEKLSDEELVEDMEAYLKSDLFEETGHASKRTELLRRLASGKCAVETIKKMQKGLTEARLPKVWNENLPYKTIRTFINQVEDIIREWEAGNGKAER